MIILTGSAGFIGSHLAEFYHQQKQRLLLVDTPSFFRERGFTFTDETNLWDWATAKADQPDFSRHKILDREYFPKVLAALRPEAPAQEPKAKEYVLLAPKERIECIVHMGACTDTAETRPDYLAKWNVDYTKALWNWCAQHKVPFVYASSGATYGNGEEGFSDSWETAHRLRPMNAYGQSKQDFDLWAYEEVKKGNAPPYWYGLKFFNVYGPQEAHKGPMASAVLHAYRHIQKTGRCKLFRSHNPKVKDGEQSRDFIHVSDIVKLVEFVRTKKPANGLYNCGTGQARTFYAMMEALFAALGKPMQVDWMDTPEQYRKAYQYFTQAEMGKMQNAGYDAPFLSLEDGVKQYVSWLLQHEKPQIPLEKNVH